MEQDRNDRDRLKKFEAAIGQAIDPTISQLLPKREADELPTIAVLSDQLRAHAKGILELCDQLDRAANASEADARKAADALMDFMKRVK